jgi:propanediol utilization protein
MTAKRDASSLEVHWHSSEADETVTLIGPQGHMSHTIGPPRLENPVEESSTDALVLGYHAAVAQVRRNHGSSRFPLP